MSRKALVRALGVSFSRVRVVPAVVLFALEFASVGSGCEVVTRPIVPGMRFDGTVFTMRMQLDPARGGRFLALGAPSFLFRPPLPRFLR